MTKIGELTYDETLQPGDLITVYDKGFYRFVRFVPRPHNTPTLHATAAYNSKGKPVKARPYTCDASYCRRAIEAIREHELVLHALQQMK